MAKASDSVKSTREEEGKSLFLGEPSVEMSEEEIDELALKDDSFDIFIDVGEKLYKEGDRVVYTIRKDGAFLAGSIKHPFSWDQIHQKYGGGTFQVNARSSKAGKFVKSESRFLADIAVEEEDRPEEERRSTGSSAVELLAILQQSKKEEREEAMRREERMDRERRDERDRLEKESRDRMEAQKSESATMMQMMMQMMQQSNNQTTALLTALVGGKKEDVSLEKVLTLMDTRMEKMIERIAPKEKKEDPRAHYKDMQEAEDRGYKRAMDVHTLADKKAEELADLREAGGTAPKETESTVVKVIENLLPAVQGIMAARMAIPQAASQAPVSIPGVNPHRPALPAPSAGPGSVNPGAGNNQMRPPVPPKAAPPKSPTSAVMMGLNKPRVEVKPQEPMKPMSQKELIEKTVLQEMGADIGKNLLTPSNMDPEKTAEKSLQILKPFGVTPAILCSQYSLDDMISIAKAKGIPDAIRPYLERFHAHIQAQAPVGPREHAEGSKQDNT